MGQPALRQHKSEVLPVAAELPAYQAARRQRIIDAAGALLEERDYEQIQVRHVARAADFAIGTVYRYFSSKDHLYAAVLHSWGSRFGDVSRSPRGSDPLKRLETRMRKVLESFEKRPHFFRVLMLLLGSTDQNAVALLREFRESIQALVEADLAELDPERAADHAVLVWAVLSNLLTRTAFYGAAMADAYRINDQFTEMLRLRFGRPTDPAQEDTNEARPHG
jgi:TetR/AcrR family transcriptional regulator, cholesterol catabolism regulator